MPQNIVVGKEAEAVAKFVAEYAGNEAENLAATRRRRPRPSAEQTCLT